MPTCKYCHRDFRNLQAVRGHLRACPRKSHAASVAEPRLRRQEPGIGSASEPGSAGSEQAEIGAPTRSTLTSHYLLEMIEAHDLLAVLRKRCQERLWYYKFVDSCVARGGPRLMDWCQVTADLLRCEQEVGELVQRASVSRDRVWVVYQLVIDVQERWILWAESEVTQIWRKREKKDEAKTRGDVAVDYDLPLLMDQFDRLIALLRQLTATTRMGI